MFLGPLGFLITFTPPAESPRRPDVLFDRFTIPVLTSTRRCRRSCLLADNGGAALFNDVSTWTLGPEYYVELFLEPVSMRYSNPSTFIKSTGGQWTVTLFKELIKDRKSVDDHRGSAVVALSERSMRHWANLVQRSLDKHADRVRSPARRGVFVELHNQDQGPFPSCKFAQNGNGITGIGSKR